MADLQELFARLKATDSNPPPPSQQHHQHSPAQAASIWAQPNYREASVSSPLFSPPINISNAPHSANVISPVNPVSATGTSAPVDQIRASHLLNLLKFNGTQQSGPMANLQNVSSNRTGSMQLSSNSHDPQRRSLSTHDLVTSLQHRPSEPNERVSIGATASAEKPQHSGNQDFLLNLLRKPKSSALSTPNGHTTNGLQNGQLAEGPLEAALPPVSGVSREPSPLRQFGSPDATNLQFEAPQPTKAPKFSYVNPFDQLHSSSPLNKTPNPEAQAASLKKLDILKHNRDMSSAEPGEQGPALKSRKLTDDPSLDPSPMPEEMRTKHQSVSEKLEGDGEKVDKQVEQALAEAEAQNLRTKSPEANGASHPDQQPPSKKETVNNADVESSWESAEDSANEKKDFQVTVYEFPMKPWTSLQIKTITDAVLPLRAENVMSVAKLKKDFDQIDRCLSTASPSHIVYAHPAVKKDNSGFRLIRQDTGDYKQIFRLAGERIFNLQFCTPPQAEIDAETVLGTGVNGSVFWTSLAKSRADLFPDDDVEAQGFTMPAVATPEENTSGSPVKTRAKTSSRHPEYFGLARGKHIHLIIPEIVKDESYRDAKRQVNSEKYLAEHGLRINTGKAGKDFCFSEDDTVIVSLDKSGRVKFWDIGDLISHATDLAGQTHDPVELREPLWSLSAAASGSKPDEKPSVSSVMLLDKERPHSKGVALRYMLVGFKQNHILQLWDLGLGKAVQEIRLPHDRDSDGICSIGYHPRTGIITIGHPTRNSVYFIHLSAPRYSLAAPMDQARYVKLLARNDPTLQRPDSTAIMSGMRELSFAKIGQLLSLDMLRTPVETAEKGTAEEVLFELYAMHSRGVLGISIKKADLGWTEEGKNIHGVKALDLGFVTVEELKVPDGHVPSGASSTTTAATDTPSKQPMPKKENKKHEIPKHVGKVDVMKRETAVPPSPTPQGATRAKRVSAQIPEATIATRAAAINPPLITSESYLLAAQGSKAVAQDRAPQVMSDAAKESAVSPKPVAASAALVRFGNEEEASSALDKQFDSLYQRLDADKRVNEATGAARQDAMLRLVSSTLTENVEQSLQRIIGTSITNDVIPALTSTTSQLIDRRLSDTIPRHMEASVANEIKTALPVALQQVLVKDPAFHRTISDATSTQVANRVQQQVSALLQQALPNMATQAAQRMVSDLEKRLGQQQQEADAQRQKDSSKIDELSDLVRNMSTLMQNMTEKTSTLQQEIIKLQQPKSAEPQQEEAGGSATTTAKQVSADEEEVKSITSMLTDGQYEEATIQVTRPTLSSTTLTSLTLHAVAPIVSPVPTVRQSLRARQSTISAYRVAARDAFGVGCHHFLVRNPPRPAS